MRKLPPLVLALLLASVLHTTALGGLIIIALLPTYSPPFLIEPYGDSDRLGFPIAAIAVDPGAFRDGDEHTPGGDGEPELMQSEPKPSLAPLELPAAGPEPRETSEAIPMPEPSSNTGDTAPSNIKPTEPMGLPGAAGGARMAKGTPAAGGSVGSRTGVRELGASRPPYPHEAREAGIEGTVVLRLHISDSGEVLDASIHKSSGSKILDNSTLRWIRTQKFRPARQDNKPVEAHVTKAFEFSLY